MIDIQSFLNILIESILMIPLFWGLFFLGGFLLVLILSIEKATRKGVNKDDIFMFVTISALSGLLGARIFYLLLNQIPVDLETALSWGEVFYAANVHIIGGYLGAVIAGWLYLQGFSVIQRSRMSWLRFLDSFLYIVPLGMMIGYLGVFITNPSTGIESSIIYPWTIFIGNTTIHPWALYVSSAYLLLFMILVILHNKMYDFRRPGYLTSFFVIGVSAIHFITDFWYKPDSLYESTQTFGLTMTQWFSLGVLCIAGLTILFMREKKLKEA